MLKAATLSAVALMTGMVSLAGAQQWGAGAPAASAAAPVAAAPRFEAAATHRTPAGRERTKAEAGVDAVITQGHIARLRATLNLTPAQQSHWAPVEVALSELARQQANGQAAGFTQKFTDRSSAIAATASQLRRLKAIAMPLIKSLDDSQKRNAIGFARNLGFQQLVAAF
jgi:hypothetical protein